MLALIGFRARCGLAWSALLIMLSMFLIGWVDYRTGTRVSLSAFYMVPVTLSVVWLGWRTAVFTALACIAIRVTGDLAAGGYTITPLNVFWNRSADFLIYCALTGVLHALINLHRELEQRVQQRTQALAQAVQARDALQNQLFVISRRERSSIGHELHDSLGQHLAATALAAKMLGNQLESERHVAATDATRLVRLLQDGIAQTRQIARGLLLSHVEPGELAGELEELAARITRDHGTACRLTTEITELFFDVNRSSHLFYIAQEAVRNAQKHAQASRIDIALRTTSEGVLLTVTDDGIGPPAPPITQGMGLRIMAHRAELIGARFSFDAAPPCGSRVTCLLPSPAPLPP